MSLGRADAVGGRQRHDRGRLEHEHVARQDREGLRERDRHEQEAGAPPADLLEAEGHQREVDAGPLGDPAEEAGADDEAHLPRVPQPEVALADRPPQPRHRPGRPRPERAGAQPGRQLSSGAREERHHDDRQAPDAEADGGDPGVGGQRQEEPDRDHERDPGEGRDEVLGHDGAEERGGGRALAAPLQAPPQQQHLHDLAQARREHGVEEEADEERAEDVAEAGLHPQAREGVHHRLPCEALPRHRDEVRQRPPGRGSPTR